MKTTILKLAETVKLPINKKKVSSCIAGITESFVRFFFGCILSTLLLTTAGFAQSLAINNDGSTAHASAILDIKSNSKGLLIPSTSSSSRLAIVGPANGLLVYDTTTGSFWYYNNTAWAQLPVGNSVWSLTGNAGTDTSVNFIGTTDASDIVFKVNNIRRMSLTKKGYLNLTGNFSNTVMGDSAGASNTTGFFNHFIGYQAGAKNTTGYHNQFSGFRAGYNNTTGYNNHFEGLGAGVTNTTGFENYFSGVNAGFSNTTGSGNHFSGLFAGAANTTGVYNYFSGNSSGASNTTGSYNTATGTYSLYSNTLGNYNTAFGSSSLRSNTVGTYNTAFGSSALYFNKTGNRNIAIGEAALLYDSSGSENTAVGHNALYSNRNGNNNTAVGKGSLVFATGSSNTAIGWNSMHNHRSPDYNTALGSYSMYNDTSGSYNTAIGHASLYLNRNGQRNTALGHGALYSNTAGNNTAVGYAAAALNTTGVYNVVVGDSAMYSNSTGIYNTAVGAHALTSNTTGDGNTAMGFAADVTAGGFSNATAIGYNAKVDASNKVRLGSTTVSSIGGQVGWTTFSDGRFKQQIKENVKGIEFIKQLRPVTYIVDLSTLDKYYNADSSADVIKSQQRVYQTASQRESGFIAQEVEAAARKNDFTFSGVDAPTNGKALYGLRYGDFVVPLVKAVQEQQTLIEKQTLTIDTLKRENEDIRQRLERLEKLLTTKQ